LNSEFNFRHLTIMLSLGIKGTAIIFIMPVEDMGTLRLVYAKGIN